MMRPLISVTVLVVLVVLGLALRTASTAANTVPGTRMDQILVAITADDLKPSECAGLNLTTVVVGEGVLIDGTAGNDLILTPALGGIVNGHDGDDCIVGGGLVDLVDGGAGNDVCIGKGGIDQFIQCEREYQ